MDRSRSTNMSQYQCRIPDLGYIALVYKRTPYYDSTKLIIDENQGMVLAEIKISLKSYTAKSMRFSCMESVRSQAVKTSI